MPTTEPWYEVVEGASIEQGDVVQGVLLPMVLTTDPNRPHVVLERVTAVVLTQTCDIVQGKTPQLLLAAVVAYGEYAAARRAAGDEFVASRRFRKAVLDGSIPALALLHDADETPKLPWSIVDFRRLYPWPIDDATGVIERLGPRLRLRSPYREHLSQSFARYFMRVGLPTPAEAFLTYEPVS